MEKSTVQEVMERKVIAVHPEDSVFAAHEVIASHNFDGVPVVDAENRLAGILTEYDLIAKGSSLHLPTFQKILSELEVYKKDKSRLNQEIIELKELKVKDVMNSDPLTLPDTASFEDVVAAFRDHHRVNPIPIIDKDHKVIGVVSRYDVLKLFSLVGSTTE
ncbi:MAG: CBS domain-containing protein [Candidatus Sungiibacteriota bacterium]